MKKKIFLSLLILFGIICLTGCNNQNNETNIDNNSTPNNNETSNSNISFSQTNTILGYTISYPTNSSVSNSKYGKAFSYGNDISVITEGPASVGNVFSVNSLEEAVDECKDYIYNSLESRNTNLFNSNSTTQIIKSSKQVKINNIDMLKVKGVFNNSRNNKNVDYVAYYMLATSSNGTSYPIYIVGISLTENNNSLESFVDTMVSKISK